MLRGGIEFQGGGLGHGALLQKGFFQGDPHLVQIHAPVTKVGRKKFRRIRLHVAGVTPQLHGPHVRALPRPGQHGQQQTPADIPAQAMLGPRFGSESLQVQLGRGIHAQYRHETYFKAANF